MFKTNVVTEKRPPNPVADLFLEPPLSISDAYLRFKSRTGPRSALDSA